MIQNLLPVMRELGLVTIFWMLIFRGSRRTLAKTAACGRVVHSTHRQVLARTDLDGLSEM